MYKHSPFICSALFAMSLAGVATPGFAGGSTAAGNDKASIEALEARFIEAINARDLDAIMQVYSPGASLFVFDVTPPRQHVGWQDYKKDWQELLAAFPGPVTTSISDLSVTVVGPVAYSHSIQQAQLTRKDGSKVNLVVRVTDVYRKRHGGWLIVQEHVSVPVDLDAQKPDLLSKP
jgi:ketosteroid isomerase-like protein